MDILLAFINTYGVTILYGILVGVGSYVGLKLKALVEQYLTDKQKRKVVESVVKAVEQMYHEMDGTGKLEKAREGVVDLLAAKGIQITDFELRMLIESVVSSFNYSFGIGKSAKTDTSDSSVETDIHTDDESNTEDAEDAASITDSDSDEDNDFLATLCHWVAENFPIAKRAAAQAGKQEEGDHE